MKKTVISVTEAARNFADCVNHAHCQNPTFILLRNGSPVARLIPDSKKGCTGPELAEALERVALSEAEAKAWYKDLRAARKALRSPTNRFR
jgi:antitoxin (DNA-binding transcriptional repressor) of toxin-antitoxin stability system